ncbi:MAG: DUF3598 family protein [Synechococcaceae cyanobacterium]|jgi:hypothetical protein
MASQWENFLRNLGEWRGSFTSISPQGELQESTASLLSLEELPGERLVRFRLRRYGPEGTAAPPTREMEQELRSLGRQVVFFVSGAFAKGSLQLAPGTPGGGEFAFVHADRRHRLVQLYSAEGQFTGLVLIREFRVGCEAAERPPLEPELLLGSWRGEAATIRADWPEPEPADCRIEVRTGNGGLLLHTAIGDETGESPAADGRDRLLLLPDGGWSLTPLALSHRAPARLEAGWLTAPNRMERLIRRFDASGAWQSSTWIVAERA